MKIVKKEITPKSTVCDIMEYGYEKENIRLPLPENQENEMFASIKG